MSSTITREEIQAKQSRGDHFVLAEALGESYFQAQHLPGAINMPLDRIGEVARRAAPLASTEVVVYCASDTCRNSDLAAEKLRSLGYENVRVYTGGKADWKAA